MEQTSIIERNGKYYFRYEHSGAFDCKDDFLIHAPKTDKPYIDMYGTKTCLDSGMIEQLRALLPDGTVIRSASAPAKPRKKRISGELAAKAEAAMMGFGQRVNSNDDAAMIAAYIIKTLTGKDTDPGDVLAGMSLSKTSEIKAVTVCRVFGDMVISFPMQTEEDGGYFDLYDPAGCFGYCLNVSAPDCSEYGYSVYENNGGKLRRKY